MPNESLLRWRAFKHNKEADNGLYLPDFDWICFAVARIY